MRNGLVPGAANSPAISDAFVTKIKGEARRSVIRLILVARTMMQGSKSPPTRKGNAYITGNTDSMDFPVVNPLQGPPGNGDVFVTKMNPAGTALVYSTFLAGSGLDNAADIKIDAVGDAYVYGGTTSNNFPVSSALQTFAGRSGFICGQDQCRRYRSRLVHLSRGSVG